MWVAETFLIFLAKTYKEEKMKDEYEKRTKLFTMDVISTFNCINYMVYYEKSEWIKWQHGF